MHDRQLVLDCDVERADDLLDRQRIPGAAFHGRIVGMDDDFAAGDNADTGDAAGAGRFTAIGAIRRQRREFEERRAWIEELLQPLARRHLALLREPIEIALWTRMSRRLLFLVQ